MRLESLTHFSANQSFQKGRFWKQCFCCLQAWVLGAPPYAFFLFFLLALMGKWSGVALILKSPPTDPNLPEIPSALTLYHQHLGLGQSRTFQGIMRSPFHDNDSMFVRGCSQRVLSFCLELKFLANITSLASSGTLQRK